MTNYNYTVLLEPGEDGWIVARCPLLHAVSQGRTEQEALTNIREAMALCVEDYQASGETVPPNEGVSAVDVAFAV